MNSTNSELTSEVLRIIERSKDDGGICQEDILNGILKYDSRYVYVDHLQIISELLKGGQIFKKTDEFGDWYFLSSLNN